VVPLVWRWSVVVSLMRRGGTKGGGTKVVAQKVVEMVTDFCLPEIACKKTIVSFICRNLNNKFAMCAILDFSDSTRYPLRSSQMLSPFGQGIREPPAK